MFEQLRRRMGKGRECILVSVLIDHSGWFTAGLILACKTPACDGGMNRVSTATAAAVRMHACRSAIYAEFFGTNAVCPSRNMHSSKHACKLGQCACIHKNRGFYPSWSKVNLFLGQAGTLPWAPSRTIRVRTVNCNKKKTALYWNCSKKN